jgi:hypothetical protein
MFCYNLNSVMCSFWAFCFVNVTLLPCSSILLNFLQYFPFFLSWGLFIEFCDSLPVYSFITGSYSFFCSTLLYFILLLYFYAQHCHLFYCLFMLRFLSFILLYLFEHISYGILGFWWVWSLIFSPLTKIVLFAFHSSWAL